MVRLPHCLRVWRSDVCEPELGPEPEQAPELQPQQALEPEPEPEPEQEPEQELELEQEKERPASLTQQHKLRCLEAMYAH